MLGIEHDETPLTIHLLLQPLLFENKHVFAIELPYDLPPKVYPV